MSSSVAFLALVVALPAAIALRMPSMPSSVGPRSCSCGAVTLHVNSPILQVCHCHCRGCRTSTGASFSTWGCVPLESAFFEHWSTLRRHQRRTPGGELDNSPTANRYFCSECGCHVAMNYPKVGRWPEPNTLWLSAAFLPDDADDFGDVIHMYPEERPDWCKIDKANCDEEALTYMGGPHQCVVRETVATHALVLGGRAGEPRIDEGLIQPLPPAEQFRLRGRAPAPVGVPEQDTLAVDEDEVPLWSLPDSGKQADLVVAATVKGGFEPTDAAAWLGGAAKAVDAANAANAAAADAAALVAAAGNGYSEGPIEHRAREVEILGLGRRVAVFEVADPSDVDGCDVDSPRSHLCGGILWPGARTAAEVVAAKAVLSGDGDATDPTDPKCQPSLRGRSVVEMGCGTGLVSLTAAAMGANDVFATDHSAATLSLVEAAAMAQGLSVRTGVVDLTDPGAWAAAPLAEGELAEGELIAVAADLLYTEEISRGVARACVQLLVQQGAEIVVTDSQHRWADAFVDEFERLCGKGKGGKGVAFEKRRIGRVTGYSYPDKGDATYAVTVGVLQVGPGHLA